MMNQVYNKQNPTSTLVQHHLPYLRTCTSRTYHYLHPDLSEDIEPKRM